jgi:hypothetical protein
MRVQTEVDGLQDSVHKQRGNEETAGMQTVAKHICLW